MAWYDVINREGVDWSKIRQKYQVWISLNLKLYQEKNFQCNCADNFLVATS